MSGQLAVSTATKLFKRSAPPVNQDASSHKSNSSQFSPTSHRIYYGHVVDTSGQVLDEVLMLPMLKPRSYTREDVVELHCHGGGVCAQRILEACLQQGCRLAEPGEFTLRAFLNGRLDLSQAESVAQLVTARTASAADSALAGLQVCSNTLCCNSGLPHAVRNNEHAWNTSLAVVREFSALSSLVTYSLVVYAYPCHTSCPTSYEARDVGNCPAFWLEAIQKGLK